METVDAHSSSSRLSKLWISPVFRLVLLLAIGKLAVILAVFLVGPSPPNLLQLMAIKWDGGIYQTIATKGYTSSSLYVFSPDYPSLVRVVNSVVGSAWVSAYLVTNALSFVFPVLLYRTFGFRTALFAELFPTYLLFSTIPYSDVVALIALAGCFLLLLKDRVTFASVCVSEAILTFFNLAWILPSFLFALLEKKRRRQWRSNLFFYVVPLMMGGLIAVWLKAHTGAYLDIEKLEAPWGVTFVNPITQAVYLLCPNGTGTYTCQRWEADGIFLPPLYWLVRNVLFEAFYVFGAFYLLKTAVRFRVFFCVYCLSVTIPLLFWTGFVSLSIPRLLLPAFPIFIGYSTLLKRYQIPYAILCIALAGVFSVFQYLAYFS
jgi:hypothetical protein